MQNLQEGYPVTHFSRKTKRYCQTLDLREEPELIATYKQLHSEAGILEMEIFLLGSRLFMIVEMPADLDWDTAMQKMGQMPKQKEWEALTAKYQKANPDAGSAEKWQLMERIFHLYT